MNAITYRVMCIYNNITIQYIKLKLREICTYCKDIAYGQVEDEVWLVINNDDVPKTIRIN